LAWERASCFLLLSVLARPFQEFLKQPLLFRRSARHRVRLFYYRCRAQRGHRLGVAIDPLLRRREPLPSRNRWRLDSGSVPKVAIIPHVDTSRSDPVTFRVASLTRVVASVGSNGAFDPDGSLKKLN
jgi:hypothetical protein